MSTDLTSGLAHLASYSTRAAKATAMLSKFRDEDIEIATTPRELVAQMATVAADVRWRRLNASAATSSACPASPSRRRRVRTRGG